MLDYLPLVGQFFMREQKRADGQPVTMVIGIIPGKLVTHKFKKGTLKGVSRDELWVMQFIPTDIKKFIVPERYAGHTVEQILGGGPRVSECEEFKA